jgi:hypothetical protein
MLCSGSGQLTLYHLNSEAVPHVLYGHFLIDSTSLKGINMTWHNMNGPLTKIIIFHERMISSPSALISLWPLWCLFRGCLCLACLDEYHLRPTAPQAVVLNVMKTDARLFSWHTHSRLSPQHFSIGKWAGMLYHTGWGSKRMWMPDGTHWRLLLASLHEVSPKFLSPPIQIFMLYLTPHIELSERKNMRPQ